MIENSDNDAATELYEEVGDQSGLAAFMRGVGVSGLSPESPEVGWGWSTITPAAMVGLLERLHDGAVLTATERALALRLMENVESDQQVGVGDTRPEGATVALKDGWVPGPDGLWAVNSSGIVTAGAETYVIAVYTVDNDKLEDGFEIVRHVCEVVADRLAGAD